MQRSKNVKEERRVFYVRYAVPAAYVYISQQSKCCTKFFYGTVVFAIKESRGKYEFNIVVRLNLLQQSRHFRVNDSNSYSSTFDELIRCVKTGWNSIYVFQEFPHLTVPDRS